MVLRGVLVSGPITALASASPQRKVTISGRRTSDPRGGRKEGPQGRQGSVTPVALCQRGTITSPLLLLRCEDPWSLILRVSDVHREEDYY